MKFIRKMERKMEREVESIDDKIISFLRKISIPAGRVALFIIFFWFGALKLVGTSPANPLVSSLPERTLPFMTFDTFIFLFAIYEMIIGVTFLIPRLSRLAIALLALHMVTTFMPLILLTSVTWSGFMTPTLEGQYIIKNLVIIALAFGIAAHLTPLSHEQKNQSRNR